MKTAILSFCLLGLGAFSAGAKPLPYRHKSTYSYTVSVHHKESRKAIRFYLPNACQGFLNEYIEGHGTLSVAVQGKIQQGKAVLQLKLTCNGEARSSLGCSNYLLHDKARILIEKPVTEPTTLAISGQFKLSPRKGASSLYVGNIGYLTVYPDGRVSCHLFESAGPIQPAIYCREE